MTDDQSRIAILESQLDEARSRLSRAEGENAKLQAESSANYTRCEVLAHQLRQTEAAYDKLKAELERLQKYASHSEGCYDETKPDKGCLCGLEALNIPKPQKEGGGH